MSRRKLSGKKKGLGTRKPETKDLGSLIPEGSEDKPGKHLGSPSQEDLGSLKTEDLGSLGQNLRGNFET